MRRYKWRAGDCIETYGTSANVWREYTSTAEFAAAFSAIVEDDSIPNDTRSARAEQFLMDQATKAGVLEVTSSHRDFTNPNKWDKHLAPWFSEKCSLSRRAYRKACKRFGKHHHQTIAALQKFVGECKSSRAQMQFDLPLMLKKRPR